MGSSVSHIDLEEEDEIINYHTLKSSIQALPVPNSIKHRQRTRYEIETINHWKNILSNDENNNSIRGMLWYQLIGNDLNISWNAYNHYKVRDNQHDINHNECNDEMQSIFGNNNPSSFKDKGRKNSIKRDLQRMYDYDKNTKTQRIEYILIAFCNYNKDVSYTQFMAHLVEILLKYQNDKMCFISLCNMLNYQLFDIFLHFDMNKIQKRINIFKKILYHNSPKLAEYLNSISIKNKIDHLFDGYIMDCIQTLFSRQLSIDIVYKICDLYFESGEVIIWKCTVLLLMEIDKKLLIVDKKRDINYIMNVLHSVDKSLIDINAKCFINTINLIKLPFDVNRLFINQQ